MSSKCFVPHCKNTVGVVFPEEPDLKKKWLESLKIEDISPNLSSFVCLGHFEDSDLIEGEDSVEIKEGALPTKVIATDTDNVKDVESKSEELCQDIVTDLEQTDEIQMKTATFIVDSGSAENAENEMPFANESAEKPVNVDKERTDDYCKEIMSNEDTNDSVLTENEETGDISTFSTNDEKKTCRLCTEETCSPTNIFEEKVENVPVSVAIMECIYPIEISRNDKLSKEICPSCLECINSYFKFRSVCLENDRKQRDIHDESEQEISDGKSTFRITDLKRKGESSRSSYFNKKPRIQEIFSDSDDEFDEEDDLESLSDFLMKEKVHIKEDKPASKPPPLLVPLQKKPLSKERSDAIKKKFDKVEEELRRVLEGQLTEEQAKAENIIIHVEKDEEESPKKVAITKLKLPIVIKPVDKQKVNNKGKFGVISASRTADVSESSVILKTGAEVALPKCINVKVRETYKSAVGVYEAIPVIYVFDIEFCQVNGYLFEYRLCKGSIRYLRCVLPACPGFAIQGRIKPGLYSSEATVQTPHNHRQPDDAEKRKQMFYYVMKRKMQSDKTLNFRSVYDEVCNHDPQIKELVPLRSVINEICRHQLSYKIPPINTFDQFYEHIEDDALQKLHFTHNGAQFYQERFTASDDSKAVIFANTDIVEQVSDSNLMYIDASFKIDTNEEFKYQLMTVLVWIDDSYYPILYALVNKKTQEIYKKIFEYLHDYLAPKLRPHEIVTDYEASLYYALGETYLDSAIGGSVFYYTQNLYKKICALNLSRDLETNSYFRNIYHMLLMLPLLPVNTILDGLNNMEIQARDLGLSELTRAIFDHVRTEWIMKVTPDLFCVHRLESRINENVIAPFKKLRDFIMLSKGKMQRQHTTIVTVVEKLIELEHFLQITYSAPNKKSFARDLSSSQKKNVLKAWQYIESHPKININNFFSKVLGYIKCMENQLWIWGFYRYDGEVTDDLINATNFSIVSNDVEVPAQVDSEYVDTEEETTEEGEHGQIVMEAVIDENGGFVLQNGGNGEQGTPFENAFLKYVYKEDT